MNRAPQEYPQEYPQKNQYKYAPYRLRQSHRECLQVYQ